MNGFVQSLEKLTESNDNFRHVVYTSSYMQLVLMTLKPSESIGMEVHGNDQFFRFETGTGEVEIDGIKHVVKAGSGVIVPAGAKHNVSNTSTDQNLKLYTIYSPPHHKDGVAFKTKGAAENSREEFDGQTSETSTVN